MDGDGVAGDGVAGDGAAGDGADGDGAEGDDADEDGADVVGDGDVESVTVIAESQSSSVLQRSAASISASEAAEPVST